MMDDRDRCMSSSYGPEDSARTWQIRAQLAMRRGTALRAERDRLKDRVREADLALETAEGIVDLTVEELRRHRATLRETAEWLRAQGWSGAADALGEEVGHAR